MLNIVSVNNVSSTAYDLVPLGHVGSMLHHPPTDIAHMVRSGEVDVALLPVACLDNATQRYEALGNFGIACSGAVESVLLFCSVPLETIAEEELPIYITPHSRTSRALLQYLYHRRFGRHPVLSEKESSAFAHLYIGNDSLDFAQSRNKDTEIIDLSDWWYQETRYPFVFARWVVRHDVDEQDKATLIEWLNESTRIADSASGQELMALNNRNVFDSSQQALDYYSHLRYRLGDDEHVGLSLFLTSIRKMHSCHQTA